MLLSYSKEKACLLLIISFKRVFSLYYIIKVTRKYKVYLLYYKSYFYYYIILSYDRGNAYSLLIISFKRVLYYILLLKV